MDTKTFDLAEKYLAARRSGGDARAMLADFAPDKRKALPHKVARMLRDITRPTSTMQADAHRALAMLRRKPGVTRERPRAYEFLTRDGSDVAYLRRSSAAVGLISLADLLAIMAGEK